MTKLETLIIDRLKSDIISEKMFLPDEPIILAISGGKDSLAMYKLIKQFHTKIYPVHIKNKRDQQINFSMIDEVEVIETDIYDQSHLPDQRKNPCFICSRLRRKKLLEYAESKSSNKICFAHHQNDVIETLLLNMLFSREISTIKPVQSLFSNQYFIIRPLFNIEEELILKYCKEQKFIIQTNDCPENLNSKRAYIRNLLKSIKENHPKIDIYDNLFSSLKHIKEQFLPFDIEKVSIE